MVKTCLYGDSTGGVERTGRKKELDGGVSYRPDK